MPTINIIFYFIIFLCILGLFFAIRYVVKERKKGGDFFDIFCGPKEYRKSKKYNLITLPFYFFDLLNRENKNKYNYQELFKEYDLRTTEHFSKAIKIFPSKHLIDSTEEWHKVVEKQSEYSQKQDYIWLKQLKEKHNLSDEEWETLKAKLSFDLMVNNLKNKETKPMLKKLK